MEVARRLAAAPYSLLQGRVPLRAAEPAFNFPTQWLPTCSATPPSGLGNSGRFILSVPRI